MALPPRPFLTEDQMRALTPEEQAQAIAEWSSYNARLRMEQEQRTAQGSYRGATRGRGRGGRGYYGYSPYQPYPPKYTNISANFQSTKTTAPNSPSHQPVASAHPRLETKKKEEPIEVKSKTPCSVFTATGVCKRNHCTHLHDPDKTAICKTFLFKDNCSNGNSCALSHEPNPHRSPHCIHFLNDSCNKDRCHYAHVHVNSAAPVCDAFARLGYCEKGAECTDRHAFECPDFTNKGSCEVKGCRLPHIVHAGRLRKAARAYSSEIESRQPSGSPGTDEDAVVQDVLSDPVDAHALTQQADFIPLES
ncbi:hypothetical protein B0J11DRAFT_530595 [Dendryphion nanum]|uniref:C3H1-type domain-containing protein n=1 Tax=Dendryphion nanum TaxID=256645 RepID=A0A9P9DQW4_9PLEO|nr:hypothetical protein B0J11DRAFT_530595 [Dendryphion nanum]